MNRDSDAELPDEFYGYFCGFHNSEEDEQDAAPDRKKFSF
jgi:hypothetical protein